jgi:hypothetical protein
MTKTTIRKPLELIMEIIYEGYALGQLFFNVFLDFVPD